MKISFGVVIILLVICSAFSGYLWYQLEAVKTQLNSANVELEAVKAQLNATNVELDNVNVQLGETKNILNIAENQLIEVENELSTTKAELNETVTNLNMTKNQLQITRDDKTQMLNKYSGFKRQIANRIGATNEDRQGFITTDNYLVYEKAQEITRGYSEDTNEYWGDLYRLYKWVVNNISYSHDSYVPLLPESLSGELIWHGEYWRLPEETLEDATGDCEDMATLLISLMRSYNQENYAVWGMAISSGVPDISGHIGVAFPVKGGKLTILDPAGNYYTGYGSLVAESSYDAVNKWLAHWENDIPEAFISAVFADDFYYEFSNTTGFLEWLEGR